jgi:glycerophosphoryl diester phosphodiesterase
MAFEAETWRRVRQLSPDARAGALYSARMLPSTAVEPELEALRQAGVTFVGLNQALVNAEVAKQARLAGLTLGAWTVNERDAIARFIEQGVGVVITDRPDLAKELLGR